MSDLLNYNKARITPMPYTSQFVNAHKKEHMDTSHQVLRYIKAMPAQGIFLRSNSNL